jgi:hypothetical protein
MIELLFWEGCPSYPRALEALAGLMAELGLEPDDLSVTEILTQEAAEAEGFIGSPTIRLNGEDIVDPGDTPPALDCRIYYRRDGKVSPLPDPDDLRDAIANYASQKGS